MHRVCLIVLKANANNEAVDNGGWTPLIWAAMKRHAEVRIQRRYVALVPSRGD
jgi:ankyrin repeat protein